GAAAPQVQLHGGAARARAARALHEVDDLPQLRAREDLLQQSPHAGHLRDAEHAGGRAVDGGDASERVEGDDAGGDGLQHGLDVAAAVLQLRVLVLQVYVRLFQTVLGLQEVVGHPVERLHEGADLVVAARLDLVGQVAGRDLARALGELLDGAGDAAGQVEREPGEREDHDEGHQQEEQDVDALDRVLQQLELLV